MSFEKAKMWVRELQRQADPNIVIMLVGNKVDLEAQRRMPKDVAEQYAADEGLLFIEASAKTGQGVGELFMEIGEFGVDVRVAADGVAKKLPVTPPPPRPLAGKGVTVSGDAEETPKACTC